MWILLGTSASARQAPSNPSVEAQVKAAFLFNFAQFVQWPGGAFPDPDSPFTMCVIGDSVEGPLEKTIEGETLNGRRIVMRRPATPENIRACHLIYVARGEARRSMEIIVAASGVPILTVGDSEEFINEGGMIRFTEAGRRIRFEINPDAAESASLRVSSRLLRLADIARPRQRAAR
jgi:hypothetical protein